ncbi:odorant binding protein C20 [Tribolium castaneum]|uniref:Odorant binding protein C20 n=1 Tax=Tribolium castaneum TaxID=7070 RepID=D6WDX0_TRICA|nr:odorant binding protein C20 [Tribolium castaneum]
MKKTILLCLLSQLLLLKAAELQPEDRHQIALQCIDIVGIDQKVVEDAINIEIPKNNPKYKEFLACSYKKQGYQNENGEILMENIKKFLQKFYHPSDLQELNSCSGHNGTNHAENAYQALQCIYNRLSNMTVVGN